MIALQEGTLGGGKGDHDKPSSDDDVKDE